MPRRQISQREQALHDAQGRLQAGLQELKQLRRQTAAARAEIARLSRCDFCHDPGQLRGSDLMLCHGCWLDHLAARKRAARIAAYAQFGRDPNGVLLPRLPVPSG